MNKFFLSLGTNKSVIESSSINSEERKKIQNRGLRANLDKCIKYLAADKNIKLLEFSSDYLTEPFEMESKNWFLNKVIKIKTGYRPEKLLDILKTIEKKMGREIETKNFKKYGENIKKYRDRIIDIDILDCDGQILKTSNLIIPHPRMHERLFVLLPLKEISQNWIHPILKRNIDELIENISLEYKFLKCEKLEEKDENY